MKAPVIDARVIVESALFQATKDCRERAEAEAQRYRNALVGIRGTHAPDSSSYWCQHDGRPWPCPTRQAVDAALRPAGGTS